MFYLYKIENTINGKLYIGKTIRPIQRKSRHFNAPDNIHLKNAIKKYGKQSFNFDIFECYASEDECYQAEKYWVDYLKSQNVELYNLVDGGKGGCFGLKLSQEHKSKISKSNMGRIVSEDTRKKISEATKNRKPSYGHAGKFHSEKTKYKMSLSRSKLTNKQKNSIKRDNRTYKLIAADYHVCIATIHNIKHRSF